MDKGFESFTAFAQEVERREAAKADYIVDTRAVTMTSPDTVQIAGGGQQMDFGMKPTAHEQLAARLGIPKKYYDRTAQIVGLREANVNALMHEAPMKSMVRTMEGNARAWLSDAYKPFDNVHLMTAMMPVLEKHRDNLTVHSFNLTDDQMYLQVRFPKIQGMVSKLQPGTHNRVNEPIQAMVTIKDSETGKGGVDILLGALILACTNGLVMESVYRRVHKGRRLGSEITDYNVFRNATIQADIRAHTMMIQDLLAAALDEAAFMEKLKVINGATEREIKDVELVVQNVTNRWGFNDGERKALMNALVRDGDTTQWGLSNATTVLAHGMRDADRAFTIEKVGWEIIEDLDDKQWDRFNTVEVKARKEELVEAVA